MLTVLSRYASRTIIVSSLRPWVRRGCTSDDLRPDDLRVRGQDPRADDGPRLLGTLLVMPARVVGRLHRASRQRPGAAVAGVHAVAHRAHRLERDAHGLGQRVPTGPRARLEAARVDLRIGVRAVLIRALVVRGVVPVNAGPGRLHLIVGDRAKARELRRSVDGGGQGQGRVARAGHRVLPRSGQVRGAVSGVSPVHRRRTSYALAYSVPGGGGRASAPLRHSSQPAGPPECYSIARSPQQVWRGLNTFRSGPGP